jgi:hypothetical protein
VLIIVGIQNKIEESKAIGRACKEIEYGKTNSEEEREDIHIYTKKIESLFICWWV